MALENITDKEKERFKNLQKEGFLPSQALRKIEIEKKLGVSQDNVFSEKNLFYLGLGAISLTILYIYIKGSSQTTQTVSG